MVFDVYVICLLFFVGILLAKALIVIGLKRPIHSKVINTCNKCNREYKWFELIPLVSYFLCKGKCPYCKSKLDFSYVFLELILGLLFSL